MRRVYIFVHFYSLVKFCLLLSKNSVKFKFWVFGDFFSVNLRFIQFNSIPIPFLLYYIMQHQTANLKMWP